MAQANFTETVGNASFEMIYVPGGTFTIGCTSSSGCPADAAPVSGVSVSNYFIARTTVTRGLWNAVMGTTGGSANSVYTNMDWYDAMEFACKLSEVTGKNYRMATEAEWEYAAKNHAGSLAGITSNATEEWAYNSWSGTHSGGVDPVGPGSGQHTQKTRRNARGTGTATDANITGRLIRSIEGYGPALRLVLSAGTNFPLNYVSPCDLRAPEMGAEPVNSYRDPRWITGSGSRWIADSETIAIGSFELRAWEDGTAVMTTRGWNGQLTNTNGQWFTSNNIAFVFVPSSGAIRAFPYIFLDETKGSLISGQSFTNGGFIGRIVKETASNLDKPTVSNLRSGADLAAAAGNDYRMVDMVNIPTSARQQDPRLIDETNEGWFQDNRSAGGVHHYRKDIDADEFRFTVNQDSRIMLANGNWFTVNNMFLRVTHSTGYTVDYLYTVTPDGVLYHNSFMAYERGDFRMFRKTANGSDVFNFTCGNACSGEIPKGEGASMYARVANGHSTFVPAPCPTGGCR
jgi:hypothetical protein